MPGTSNSPCSALSEPDLNSLSRRLIDAAVLDFGPTEIFPPGGAMRRAIPVSADRAAPAGPAHPREKPASRRGRAKSRETWTLRWWEMDSNFQYAGAVNLVVSPFGWVVLCDRVRAGRGASGTARYQRRGWAILAAGLGAAHRRSDLWCARLGSTRSDDCLFNRTTLREAEGPSARECTQPSFRRRRRAGDRAKPQICIGVPAIRTSSLFYLCSAADLSRP